MGVFCSECGSPNSEESRFCQSCGSKLESLPYNPDGRAAYTIEGSDMQFVEIELEPGECVIAEAGAMMYMEQGIQMEAIFGDGSGKEGKT